MFSSELPAGFPLYWIAHLWIEAWPLESDGKQSEVDHRGKACIASPKQIRKRPIPGTQASQETEWPGFAPTIHRTKWVKLSSEEHYENRFGWAIRDHRNSRIRFLSLSLQIRAQFAPAPAGSAFSIPEAQLLKPEALVQLLQTTEQRTSL
jgi:hypothetical protein